MDQSESFQMDGQTYLYRGVYAPPAPVPCEKSLYGCVHHGVTPKVVHNAANGAQIPLFMKWCTNALEEVQIDRQILITNARGLSMPTVSTKRKYTLEAKRSTQ